MNKYGAMAQKHMQDFLPEALAQIENPQEHFEALGVEVASRIVDLSMQLEGPDLPGEEYLAKVGRLNAVKKQAEELVLTHLVWLPPEISEAEEREEWESVQRYSLDALTDWAMEMQNEDPTRREQATPLDWVAKDYMLSEEFLREMLQVEPPNRYLYENESELQAAADRRWARYQPIRAALDQ